MILAALLVAQAIGGGAYAGSPNYNGALSDSAQAIVQGSMNAPVTTNGGAIVVQKFSSSPSFQASATLAVKSNSSPYTRGTAIYGEAFDVVGGANSFVEGGRLQATLMSGTGGSAYGNICSAGTNATGVVAPQYLIGCEGEIDNQIGPDAPTYGWFNKNNFSASFVASNGVGPGLRYKGDAAFVVNPYSGGKFRTGLLLSSAVDDTGIAAAAGTSLATGFDLHLAAVSYSAIYLPNNAPIRYQNSGNTAGLNILNVDKGNRVIVGAEASGVSLHAPPYVREIPAAIGEVTVEATSNTLLTFRFKGSDGVVRSATLNLR